MLPEKASPNARTMPARRGLETTTATRATVTMLPMRLKTRSPMCLSFVESVAELIDSFVRTSAVAFQIL